MHQEEIRQYLVESIERHKNHIIPAAKKFAPEYAARMEKGLADREHLLREMDAGKTVVIRNGNMIAE